MVGHLDGLLFGDSGMTCSGLRVVRRGSQGTTEVLGQERRAFAENMGTGSGELSGLGYYPNSGPPSFQAVPKACPNPTHSLKGILPGHNQPSSLT